MDDSRNGTSLPSTVSDTSTEDTNSSVSTTGSTYSSVSTTGSGNSVTLPEDDEGLTDIEKVYVVFGSVSGFLFLLVLGIIFYLCFQRRKHRSRKRKPQEDRKVGVEPGTESTHWKKKPDIQHLTPVGRAEVTAGGGRGGRENVTFIDDDFSSYTESQFEVPPPPQPTSRELRSTGVRTGVPPHGLSAAAIQREQARRSEYTGHLNSRPQHTERPTFTEYRDPLNRQQPTEYLAPANTTEYGRPAMEYGRPATEYGRPATEYGRPATEYQAPGVRQTPEYRTRQQQPVPGNNWRNSDVYAEPVGTLQKRQDQYDSDETESDVNWEPPVNDRRNNWQQQYVSPQLQGTAAQGPYVLDNRKAPQPQARTNRSGLWEGDGQRQEMPALSSRQRARSSPSLFGQEQYQTGPIPAVHNLVYGEGQNLQSQRNAGQLPIAHQGYPANVTAISSAYPNDQNVATEVGIPQSKSTGATPSTTRKSQNQLPLNVRDELMGRLMDRSVVQPKTGAGRPVPNTRPQQQQIMRNARSAERVRELPANSTFRPALPDPKNGWARNPGYQV